MNKEIDINKFNKSIAFQNRGIGFTQIGVADEILNLIDDLQQENKQLKKHHICVKPYTNDEVREKIDNYKDIIKQLSKINIDKQQKIDKAVEYINKRMVEEGEYYFRKAKHFKNTEFGKDLLGILKEKEQEEYTLTPDENGTTQINGVLYRVDKK